LSHRKLFFAIAKQVLVRHFRYSHLRKFFCCFLPVAVSAAGRCSCQMFRVATQQKQGVWPICEEAV